MENAYFKNIRKEILSLLSKAKTNVLVAMAWFTSEELFQALLTCIDRNVNVEVILLDDSINYMYYAPDFNELIQRGGKFRIACIDMGFMHHKFCVIDSKIAITGSYNWTYYAETRNIENVLITDIPTIVLAYQKEFERLAMAIQLSSESPRLSWNEIMERDDVDFHQLNNEIAIICKSRNLPVQNVIKTESKVSIVETKRIPYSSCCIGIVVLDSDEREKFSVFIKDHTKLPTTSETITFFFDSKNEKEYHCSFVFGNPNNQNEWYLIKNIDILQIAIGTNVINLPIQFSMNLDIDGHLRVDVSCSVTGQTLRITVPESSFVKYE